MTVLEVIQRSAEYLAKRGVEAPRLQIELLLAHVLGLPRLQLYLNFERPVLPPQLENLRELVRRRGNREPLQHLLGTTSFCGLELEVSPEVLIPRPETELLAERAWTFLQSVGNTRPAGEPPRALDFGTGSGCLAIALAVHCPSAWVHAVDLSATALAVARANAQRHEVAARVQFWQGDGFAALDQAAERQARAHPGQQPPKYDLIVANPPYIPSAEIAGLEPEVRNHDPRLALDGGADGLDFMRRLATQAGVFLATSGRLMLEFGDGQAEAVQRLFQASGWRIEALEADYSGQPRILIARPFQA